MATTTTPARRARDWGGGKIAAAILAALVFSGTLLVLFLFLLLFAVFSGEDDSVLVIGAPLAVGALAEDDRVMVAGPVRRFILADFERELGVDLDDEAFDDWEGKPAIIARVVDRAVVAGGDGFVDAWLVDIDDLAHDAEDYLGRPVVAVGEVEDVVGPLAFVLEED